jgi:hypothetical protein
MVKMIGNGNIDTSFTESMKLIINNLSLCRDRLSVVVVVLFVVVTGCGYCVCECVLCAIAVI